MNKVAKNRAPAMKFEVINFDGAGSNDFEIMFKGRKVGYITKLTRDPEQLPIHNVMGNGGTQHVAGRTRLLVEGELSNIDLGPGLLEDLREEIEFLAKLVRKNSKLGADYRRWKQAKELVEALEGF